MDIVILGAGTVGSSVAELLCANHHDVCLLDSSRAALDAVEERLDVTTVHASACDAVALFQAGAQRARLCLAVTGSDEVNLVGGSVAKTMGASRSVARTFNPSYRDSSTFDYQTHFKIDRMLSLEHLSALELAKHMRRSSLVAIENFARGGIEVQGIVAGERAKAVGIALRDLQLPSTVRVGMVSSASRSVIPRADDVIEAGDHVTLIGSHTDIEDVKPMFEQKAPRRLNIVIAGGGEIGYNLAMVLQRMRCNVTLMEADEDRCRYLAEKLTKTTVLHADITRRSEMEEARVGNADAFVAATGRDEDNIVCGVEARELGSKRILTIVRRPDYANVLEKLGIDVAVSPRQAMAREVLGMVTAGPIIGRSRVSGGDAEVWEVEIRETAPITRAPLREISLPNSLVAAIEREDFVRVPNADDQLRAGDTAVVLVQRDSSQDTLELLVPQDDGDV